MERREECASPGTMDTFSHFSICGFNRYSFKSVASFFLRFSNLFSVPHVCCDHFVKELANGQWACSSPQHPWNGGFSVPLSIVPLILSCLFCSLFVLLCFPCLPFQCVAASQLSAFLLGDKREGKGVPQGGRGVGQGAMGHSVRWDGSEGFDHMWSTQFQSCLCKTRT